MGKSIAALAALGALLPGAILAQEVADRIWTGGSVVTIDSDNTVASAAVNRMTTGGEILGPDQRISATDALRAVTIDAAWQCFEEDRKGSLEVGKLADLVVPSANPLDAELARIAEIEILETIKEGATIHKVRE